LNVKLVRLLGIFGVIAPVVGFTMIFLAIRTAPWFSWTDNALSDLGVEGFTAVVFNAGLAMTGAVMMIFSLSIHELTKGDTLGQIGFGLLLAASFLLIGIGVFSETAGSIHYYFSVAFFASLPLSLLIQSIYLMRNDMRNISFFTAAAGAIAVLAWVPQWNAVAIPEALSSLAVGLWSAILGFWMTRIEED
jgi:hypothetical membrane protein